eukprot:m.171759 g.171759  ORF g.171759 m.171759 type:complete len:418 (+) comp15289_c0_seq1:68-1321(+)
MPSVRKEHKSPRHKPRSTPTPTPTRTPQAHTQPSFAKKSLNLVSSLLGGLSTARKLFYFALLGAVCVVLWNMNIGLQALSAVVMSVARTVSDSSSFLSPQAHNHRAFIDSFHAMLANKSAVNDGRTLHALAVQTRSAMSVVSTSIQSIRRLDDLGDGELEMLGQADLVVRRFSEIEVRTHAIASNNKKLFQEFSEELDEILTAYKTGNHDAVLASLTRVEEVVANTLLEVSKLQTHVDLTTEDTRTLQNQAVACMEVRSKRAEAQSGEVRYPSTTIAAVSLAATLVTFTAMSLGPLALVAGKAALGVGAITAMVGKDQQARANYQSALTGQSAKQLESFALAIQDVMQGLQRLNQSLNNMHSRVKGSQQATIKLKGTAAARSDDIDQFSKLVDKARSEYHGVAQEAGKILREWTNDN